TWTGVTTTVTGPSITIVGGTLGVNGGFDAVTVYSSTGTAGAFLGVSFGGSNLYTGGLGANTVGVVETWFRNCGTQSNNHWGVNTGFAGETQGITTVATGSNQTLSYTMNNAVAATTTLTMEQWSVRFMYNP